MVIGIVKLGCPEYPTIEVLGELRFLCLAGNENDWVENSTAWNWLGGSREMMENEVWR